MAKLGRIMANDRRLRDAKKQQSKRENLVLVLKKSSDPQEKFNAMIALQKISRHSMVRHRNRCEITGRPRGYFGKFDLCRNMVRHYGSFGMIPGLRKSSW